MGGERGAGQSAREDEPGQRDQYGQGGAGAPDAGGLHLSPPQLGMRGDPLTFQSPSQGSAVASVGTPALHLFEGENRLQGNGPVTITDYDRTTDRQRPLHKELTLARGLARAIGSAETVDRAMDTT